jgi:hypothetical protein
VGRWRTQGWTKPTGENPPARIDAKDTYEWLPGGFALLHRVEARVGEERVEGAEMIGWDPVRSAYITQYFGSDGQNAYHATLIEEEGALVWTMRSQTDRFAGRFTSDGNTINGHWERLDEHENWQAWMDITLTRQS